MIHTQQVALRKLKGEIEGIRWILIHRNSSVLQDDENTGREGDLYIRSVSFSPDGKHLATGAEDKQIRVSGDMKKGEIKLFNSSLLDLGYPKETCSQSASRT